MLLFVFTYFKSTSSLISSLCLLRSHEVPKVLAMMHLTLQQLGCLIKCISYYFYSLFSNGQCLTLLFLLQRGRGLLYQALITNITGYQ